MAKKIATEGEAEEAAYRHHGVSNAFIIFSHESYALRTRPSMVVLSTERYAVAEITQGIKKWRKSLRRAQQ